MSDAWMAIDPEMLAKIGGFGQLLGLATVCSAALYVVYRRTSARDADELEFASTIFLLTVATALLVSIIKQVPAVSLGLFGAMSIVRFRTPIKKPRQMIFLFIAAAIGVCCGAGEYTTTVLGTAVMSVFLLAAFKRPGKTVADATAGVTAAQETAPWSLDFVPTSLGDGSTARILLIVDEATGEVLLSAPDPFFSGAKVVGELGRLIAVRGKPGSLISDTWPEFGSQVVLDWNKASALEWKFRDSASARTSEGRAEPFIAAAHRTLRRECLDGRTFANVVEVLACLEHWRQAHNERLNSALGRQAPVHHSPESKEGGAVSGTTLWPNALSNGQNGSSAQALKRAALAATAGAAATDVRPAAQSRAEIAT